jgi:hypothetical protein
MRIFSNLWHFFFKSCAPKSAAVKLRGPANRRDFQLLWDGLLAIATTLVVDYIKLEIAIPKDEESFFATWRSTKTNANAQRWRGDFMLDGEKVGRIELRAVGLTERDWKLLFANIEERVLLHLKIATYVRGHLPSASVAGSRERDDAREASRMMVTFTLPEYFDDDEVVTELVELLSNLSAYHVACGGRGLEIDEWRILTDVPQPISV